MSYQSPNRCEHKGKRKDHVIEEKSEYTGKFDGTGDKYQVYYCSNCDSNPIELIDPIGE